MFKQWLILNLIGCALGSAAEATTLKVCELDPQVYSREIAPKIEAGIPFEVMLMVTVSDQLVGRNTVHLRPSLWDEVVTVNLNKKTLGKFPLREIAGKICSALILKIDLTALSGEKVKVQLLLNPMWAERMARLNLTTHADLENKKLIGIDWNKIAKEMPSEKILMEKEFEL